MRGDQAPEAPETPEARLKRIPARRASRILVQLAAHLDGGRALPEALAATACCADNTAEARALERLAAAVRNGEPAAATLAALVPVAAGGSATNDAAGFSGEADADLAALGARRPSELAAALRNVAERLRLRDQRGTRVRRALIMPVTVYALLLCGLGLLDLYAMPRLAPLFAGQTYRAALEELAGSVHTAMLVLVAVPLPAVLGTVWLRRRHRRLGIVPRWLELLLLGLPGVGDWVRAREALRFLELLREAQYEVNPLLRAVRRYSVNTPFPARQRRAQALFGSLRAGVPLAAALEANPLGLGPEERIIEVLEVQPHPQRYLDPTLARLRGELEGRSEALLRLAEPLATVIIGTAVALTAASVVGKLLAAYAAAM
jgi:type II secretory pathway component PulF